MVLSVTAAGPAGPAEQARRAHRAAGPGPVGRVQPAPSSASSCRGRRRCSSAWRRASDGLSALSFFLVHARAFFRSRTARDDRFKWVALANTAAAMFMATLDGSIVIIALPAIFRGIHLDPLAPGNIGCAVDDHGLRLVQAVLVVSVGRLGDMFGRVRIYNSGFVIFTAALILLSFDPFDGSRGGAAADRLAGAAGRRRVHADGQLGRDPDRRLPDRTAGIRAGHQPDRRPGGHVRRARRGRPAGRHRLARGVLGQRACRHLRDGLGLPSGSATTASGIVPASTGGATSPSPSG